MPILKVNSRSKGAKLIPLDMHISQSDIKAKLLPPTPHTCSRTVAGINAINIKSEISRNILKLASDLIHEWSQ